MMFLWVIYADSDAILKNDIVITKSCNSYGFEKDIHSGDEKSQANFLLNKWCRWICIEAVVTINIVYLYTFKKEKWW